MRKWYYVPIFGFGVFAARSEAEAVYRATFEQQYGNYAHLFYEPCGDFKIVAECDSVHEICDVVALLDKGYRLHSNGSLEKENGAERLE